MAVIGSAHVVIRAITDKIESDLNKALSPAVKSAGDKAGRELGQSISDGLSKVKISADSVDMSGMERKVGRSLQNISREARNNKIELEADTSNVEKELNNVGRAAGNAGKSAKGNFITNFGSPDLSNIMKRLFYQMLFGVPAIGALVGALSSLVSGLFSVASAVGPAVNALAVLPGLLGSVVAGMGSTLLAFGGIGKAFSAGNKAVGGAGGAAKGAGVAAAKAANTVSDAHEKAAEAIAEAYERAAERTEKANEDMARAQERLADVIYDNARNLFKAQRDLRDAEEGLATAQSRSLGLQNAINRAREEAISRIKELQFSVEGAAISEGRAVIALERAREKLAEVNELPPDHRLRREAELTYRQAQLDLEQARKSNEDLAKEQAESTEAGVEGSKEVVDAKNDQLEAARDLRDAEEDLADSRQELAETEIQNSRDIRDARRDILEIEEELVDIQVDLAKAISDANKDLAKSLRDVGLSAGGGGGGAAGGIDAFAEAMKNLSPEAQSFVRYLLSVQDHFRALRNEAGKELFPKLETAIGRLIGGGFLSVLGTGLRIVGGAVGDLAIRFADLSADPFFQGTFATFMSSSVTVIGSLGGALLNLVDYFTTLTAAAAPFTEAFAAWIETVSGNWAASARGNFDGLQQSIGGGVEVVKQLGRIFGNLWQSIKDVGEAARPAGQILLDAFEKATEALNELTGDDANKEAMKQYFLDVAANVQALSTMVAAAAEEFFKLGDNPGIKTIADTITNEVIPVFGELLDKSLKEVGPAMAEAFGELVHLFDTLANNGGLEAFIETLGAVVKGLNTLGDIPGVGQAIGAIAVLIGTYKALNFAVKALQVRGLIDQFKSLNTMMFGNRDVLNRVTGEYERMPSRFQKVKTSVAAMGTTFKNGAIGIKNMTIQMAAYTRGAIAATAATAKTAAAKALDTTRTLAQAAAEKIAAAAKKAGAAIQWALNAAMSANPIGLIIAAIALLVAAFVWLWNNVDGFRNFFIGVWDGIKAAAEAVGKWFSETLGPFFQKAWDLIITGVNAVVGWFQTAWDNIVNVVRTVWEILVTIVTTYINMWVTVITTVFTWISNFISTVWNGILSVIKAVWGWIVDAVTMYINLVVTVVTTVFNTISSFISTVWNGIVTVIGTVWAWIAEKVSTGINAVQTVVTTVFNNISNFIRTVWTAIQIVIANVWAGITNTISGVVNGIFNTVSNVFNSIRNTVSGIMNGISSVISNVWNGIRNTAASIINGMYGTIVNAFNSIRNGIVGVFDGMASAISGAFSAILGVVRGPINGVIALVNRAISSLNSVKVSVPDWVPGMGGQTFGINIPRIPQLKDGGTVRATAGGVLANIAEAGMDERVTPLRPSGMSVFEERMLAAQENGNRDNITINVYAQNGQDVNALANEVSRRLAFGM